MSSYYLMNKNQRLLWFSIEKSLGSEEAVAKECFVKRLPLGFYNISTWLENRDYAKHKEHFSKWLKEWDMNTLSGFIDATHCLGLNDCLWVKPVNSNLTWEDVNLYQNEFSDVAEKTAFDSGLYGLQLSTTSPEFTAEGSFPKFWKREGNDIFLYKAGQTGAANVGLEPYAEYISSNIAKQIAEQKVVDYDLYMYKGKLCSKCKMFTQEDVGFVPAYKVLDSNRKYTIANILSVFKEFGFERECAEMFFIDSVVFNQDRHLGNFGFLVDNDSFKIIGFAPLFDFNISMLCNAMPNDLKDIAKYFEEYRVEHKLGGLFCEVGQELQRKYHFDTSKFITFPIHQKYNMDIERTNRIEDIFRQNYEMIIRPHVNFYVSSISEDKDIEQ